MPFTLAHPAAALLLRRAPLPMAALVAGSMAPDVPMFVRLRGFYDLTHSPVGVLTVDLALSVVGVALWFALLRDPLVDLAPDPVRERLAATARYTNRQWLLVPLAAVLGSVTHLLWDSFTHYPRWGVRHVDWLRTTHHGHLGSEWAQYGSSVLGLLVVAGWAAITVARRPRVVRPATVPGLHPVGLVVVSLVTVVSGLAAGITTSLPGVRYFLSQTAVVGTIMMVASTVVFVAIWQVRVRRGLP